MSALQRQILVGKGLPPISEGADKLEQPFADTTVVKNVHLTRHRRSISPLQWNSFFDQKVEVVLGNDSFNVYIKGQSGPTFYLLHGGGYSALTWACLAEELSSRMDCQLIAPDLRGHGDTHTADETDLSVERQVADIIAIYEGIFKGEFPPTIIVGHSMGGALAIHVSQSDKIKLVGLVVIDVVEGTALESLGTMMRFISERPKFFSSIEEGIEWCLRTKTTRNLEAARISMPSQLKNEGMKYVWRIDLAKTEPHWVGWFKGCSKIFLRCPVPKMLVLAGADRLDTDLMVAQMQGKFQYTILPRVGHVIQEDSPNRLADTLVQFSSRFQL